MWTRLERDQVFLKETLFPKLATIAYDLKEYRNYKELDQPWRKKVEKQEPHMLAMPFKTLLRGERILDNGPRVFCSLWQGHPVEMDDKGDL